MIDEQQLTCRVLGKLIRTRAEQFPAQRDRFLLAAHLIETSEPSGLSEVAWQLMLDLERKAIEERAA